MSSAFAMNIPEGLFFEIPDENSYKYKKYAEIALYAVPNMLSKHSSMKLYNFCDVNKRKHKRSSSIILPTVGILMNASRNVTFSANVQEKTFKQDRW
jgi:hypothetical protein